MAIGPATRTERGTRQEFLPFAQPTIEESDVAAVAAVVRSGWMTSGPHAAAFEQEWSAELGGTPTLAVNSGTAAMALALALFGLPPGSAVLTTPLTFCSTAHVIEQAGCRPVFADIDPLSLTLDPAAADEVVRRNLHDVRAILPVHYAGRPCEMDALLGLADRYDLAVLEDAAHAFGASYRGCPVGAVPEGSRRAVAFSLYSTKNITTGEGGVLSAPDALVEPARLWSLHGMDRDSWRRYGPGGSWRYDVTVPGFKVNMSDIQAALGRSQLRRWRLLQERRTAIAAMYEDLLGDIDEVQLPTSATHLVHAWHLYPLRLRLGDLAVGRAEFIDRLRERNIGTSVHFTPVHMLSYYRDRYGYRPEDYPVSAAEFERLVSLPIYPRMTDDDVYDVAAAVATVVAECRRAR